MSSVWEDIKYPSSPPLSEKDDGYKLLKQICTDGTQPTVGDKHDNAFSLIYLIHGKCYR